MLDDVEDFLLFLSNYGKDLFAHPTGGTSCGVDHEKYCLYCPKCGDARRMDVRPYWWTGGNIQISGDPRRGPTYWSATVPAPESGSNIRDFANPSLYDLSCRQCDTHFTALLYRGPDGPALVVLPSCHGGLRTPHTPEAVAYYLDQAYRARSTGANSAAIAMFRGALEHLLFEQGYEVKMLGRKIRKLRSDIDSGEAPKWAMEIEPQFLEVLNDLATGAIHPNDGNVQQQSELDSELVSRVQKTLTYLLFLVYELPRTKEEALSALQGKAKILNK